MYKIIKRNYNKSRGKVLKTSYYKDGILNFLNHKSQIIKESIKDEDDFIDIERNNKIVATIYPIDCEIDYLDIVNTMYKMENLKVKGSD